MESTITPEITRTSPEIQAGPTTSAATVPTEEKRIADPYIWGIFISLCAISLVETYSASSREVSAYGVYGAIIKHAVFLLCGGGIAYALSRISYQKFLYWIPVFGFGTFILLVFTELHGEVINGAARGITVPIINFTIQPAEMAKLGVVLVIAWAMGKNQEPRGVKWKGVIYSVLVVSTFGLLLLRQGLTNTILLMAISFSMMLIGGMQWKKIGIVVMIYAVVVCIFAFIKLTSIDSSKITSHSDINTSSTELRVSQRDGTWDARIKRFMNPTPLYQQPMTSINQQEMFSRMAQANGGVIGKFPGNSRECSRLPLAFSDYVYSIIIEDTGMVGGIVLLIIYLSLFARAGNIASKCSRAVPALLVLGMAVFIVFQALFHMAINTGVFPVSGQPLPLISKGGTSILIVSVAFGIMLSVSRSAALSKRRQDVRHDIEALPDNMQGENQTML